ncbi:hypothetical protein L1987_43850 [Smallanthus sonchifolius]|uniref:Uncharacterized protein n=1 Tax=Smallanthus sonchifolius TaxID=185202 RepID=A0ACB9GP42_9ASTR|nr:hypothetical protein L1987_43850 [Smallanthus sonchifolius]
MGWRTPKLIHLTILQIELDSVRLVKTLYEIVEATLALETMIKTEYINNTWWWYWSSVSVAAKTSTIAALALRIYTPDAAIKYQKTATTSDEQHSRKMKQTSEKAKERKKTKEPEEQVERTDMA